MTPSLRSYLESISEDMWHGERVTIRPLNSEEDLIYAAHECKLKDEQRDLVNPVWFSVGRAYLSYENHLPAIIYNEKDERIGFICFSVWVGSGDAYTWSFFLDERYQGLGYGLDTVRTAVKMIKATDQKRAIKLALEVANVRAHRLYEKIGFRLLDEKDGDDLVLGL